jgi:hypothetical protein
MSSVMIVYVVVHKDEPMYVSKYIMFARTWMESKFPEEEDRKDVRVVEFQECP